MASSTEQSNFMDKYMRWRGDYDPTDVENAGFLKNKLASLTASQFTDIWKHYDTDGNGYIEEDELQQFLKEFLTSGEAEHREIPANILRDIKKAFMDEFDKNGDGKIDIRELANMLPTEENFLMIFRFDNPLESSVDFIRVWREFDKDRSGFIEADELKEFLRQLMAKVSAEKSAAVTDEKLQEYAQMVLKLYDTNKDGKLQLSEMARLLPVKDNILKHNLARHGVGKSDLKKREIARVFKEYDKNGSGTIENVELDALCKDLLEAIQTEYTQNDLDNFRKALMAGCDADHDNKISVKELSLVLTTLAMLEGEGKK